MAWELSDSMMHGEPVFYRRLCCGRLITVWFWAPLSRWEARILEATGGRSLLVATAKTPTEAREAVDEAFLGEDLFTGQEFFQFFATGGIDYARKG